MKQQIINFINKNRYPFFIIFLIFLIVSSMIISSFFSRPPEKEQIIKKVEELSATDKEKVSYVVTNTQDKANYSKVELSATFSEEEEQIINEKSLAFSYTNSATFKESLGLSDVKPISPEYIRGYTNDVTGVLSAYKSLLNASIVAREPKISFSLVQISSKNIILDVQDSEAPLFSTDNGKTHKVTLYRILLNGSYLAHPYGFLEIAVFENLISDGKSSFVDLPQFVPEKIELLGRESFNYNSITVNPLVSEDPEFVDFIVNNGAIVIEEDDLNLVPETGDVVYIIDFDNRLIAPLVSKKALLTSKKFEGLKDKTYILVDY